MIKLKNIAAVQTGYTFRTRLESLPTGSVAVIQMKDLSGDRVDCSRLLRTEIDELKDNHRVRLGDLVFRSRGTVTTSAILLDDTGEAVVSAPLLRIRVTDEHCLPQYLNWFINQPPAQAFLASHAKGTAQQMISKEALDDMDIPLPSMEHQRTIVELAALSEKEQSLMNTLSGKRKQLVSTQLMTLTKEA